MIIDMLIYKTYTLN